MKMIPTLALALALALGLGLASNAAQGETVERIVAKVNSEIITLTQLEAEVRMQLERAGTTAPSAEEIQELRRAVLDQMIDNILVLQVAEERGLRVPSRFFDEWKADVKKQMNIENDEDFERQIELQGTNIEALRKQFEQGLLLNEIRRMEVENKVSVNEEEIDKLYRDRISDYTQPARVRLREIVIRFDETSEAEARQKIDRHYQDIQQGADFAEVARMHSESSTRDAGGDLGFFNQGEVTEALAGPAFALAPGEVSEVIRLEKAFYLIKVEEKTEAKTKSLEEVRNDVAEALYRDKVAEQMQRYLRRLRERAIVDVRL